MKFLNNLKKYDEINSEINEFKLCIFIFMICGILGFFIEELYDTLYNMKLDKNGFLYGFFLPIYGWGAVAIHFMSKKTKNKPFLSFIVACIFAAVFEYLTGFVVFNIWQKRLWDYSNYFLNLDGYICLFSIMSFGLLGILYIYIIEPLIKKYINKIGDKKTNKYINIFLIVYLIDNIFSFIVKNKF